MALWKLSDQCSEQSHDIFSFGDEDPVATAVEVNHENCPGGETKPGVMGGWVCSCPCHHRDFLRGCADCGLPASWCVIALDGSPSFNLCEEHKVEQEQNDGGYLSYHPIKSQEPAMSKREKRLSVATNAVAGALYGVGAGDPIIIDDEKVEACRAIALRVLDHIDRYDAER